MTHTGETGDHPEPTYPAAGTPATELTDAEAQQLGDDCLGGASPSPLLRRAVERILAARRAAERERAIAAVQQMEAVTVDPSVEQYVDAVLGASALSPAPSGAEAALERVRDALSVAEQRQHPMDPRSATIYVHEVRAALAPSAGPDEAGA